MFPLVLAGFSVNCSQPSCSSCLSQGTFNGNSLCAWCACRSCDADQQCCRTMHRHMVRRRSVRAADRTVEQRVDVPGCSSDDVAIRLRGFIPRMLDAVPGCLTNAPSSSPFGADHHWPADQTMVRGFMSDNDSCNITTNEVGAFLVGLPSAEPPMWPAWIDKLLIGPATLQNYMSCFLTR